VGGEACDFQSETYDTRNPRVCPIVDTLRGRLFWPGAGTARRRMVSSVDSDFHTLSPGPESILNIAHLKGSEEELEAVSGSLLFLIARYTEGMRSGEARCLYKSTSLS
jgi:hypothetical protein